MQLFRSDAADKASCLSILKVFKLFSIAKSYLEYLITKSNLNY